MVIHLKIKTDQFLKYIYTVPSLALVYGRESPPLVENLPLYLLQQGSKCPRQFFFIWHFLQFFLFVYTNERLPGFYMIICRKTTKLHCSWDIAHFLSKSSSGDQANGIHWSWWFSLFLITSSIVEKFMFLWPCTNILSNAILTNICRTHCGDDTRADLWIHW